MKAAFGFVCTLCVGALLAQEATQDPVEKARAAYRDVLTLRGQGAEEVAQIKAQADKLPPKSAERIPLGKRLDEAIKRAKAPMDPFVVLFRDADWAKFDPTAEKELLRQGLSGVAKDPRHAKQAVAAAHKFLEMFPDDRMVSATRMRWLPIAQIAANQPDDALKSLRSAADELKGGLKWQPLMLLGDLKGVLGDPEGAKAAWSEVIAGGDKATAEIAAARVGVIGKPAAALEASTWVGGGPIGKEQLEGKVWLVGFWATWSPPGRGAAIVWNALHDEYSPRGLVCIGATKTYGHGYLPTDGSQMDAGGTGRQGMKPEEFVEHLTTYHTNTKLHYPCAIVEDAVLTAFGVKPLPTTVLVGRDGRIALVSTTSEADPLLNFAIERLMAAK